MNKIKRIGFAVLAVLLIVTSLTGCGVNESGYFELSDEISKLKEFNFEIQLFQELGAQIAEQGINFDTIIEGTANLENLNSIYVDANISMSLNETKLKNKVNLKITDNKVYISKDILCAFLEISGDLSEIDNSYILNQKIADEVYNSLKDIDYIMVGDLESLYYDVLHAETDIPYAKINDISKKYFKNTFSGFDSKLFMKTSKGYAMELDAEGVLSLAENLLNYTYKNKETVFDETVIYLEELYKLINTDEITEEDMNLFIEKLKDIRQDFFDRIKLALVFIRSEEVKEKIDFIKGSKINGEIYKEGKSYIGNSNFEMIFNNEKVFKISYEAEITPANVEITEFTGRAIEEEELEKLSKEIEDRINPIETLEITWFEGADSASVSEIKALNANPGLSAQPYSIIEGRIYLPLRYVGEAFGEKVEWDELNRKAYIVRDTGKTDMTGILVDSKIMVKIRDFEKLGYEVEYDGASYFSVATIKKGSK